MLPVLVCGRLEQCGPRDGLGWFITSINWWNWHGITINPRETEVMFTNLAQTGVQKLWKDGNIWESRIPWMQFLWCLQSGNFCCHFCLNSSPTLRSFSSDLGQDRWSPGRRTFWRGQDSLDDWSTNIWKSIYSQYTVYIYIYDLYINLLRCWSNNSYWNFLFCF